ncbi:MAG: DNA alkylation repair protein, partial [Anaerolineales bacterium]
QFILHLQRLLEDYTDHAYRPGTESVLPSLLASYHVPAPLLRELDKKLSVISKKNPQQALRLAEALWGINYSEFKLTAISILSAIPISESSSVFRLLEKWISNCKNQNLLKQIRESMIDQFLPTEPTKLMDKIQEWLKQDNLTLKKFGYQVLSQSIEKYPFDYLPAIYKIIQPSLYETSATFKNEILDIYTELTKRSPKEVAYLLRSAYQSKPHPNIKRIIRSTIAYYPPEQQVELENFLYQ